jgi:hypothetical protein
MTFLLYLLLSFLAVGSVLVALLVAYIAWGNHLLDDNER